MISRELLDLEVNSERVRIFQHQDYQALVGYNYTEACQFSKLWNEANLLCRGLLFDGDRCIARPFSKFFNIEEVEENLSNKQIRHIQNKEDGSLIISYFHDGKTRFSTRGSFHSEQAQIAERIWQEKYDKKIPDIVFSNWTFLFELIGPSNINVSRGYKTDDLILLSITSIQTGEEESEEFITEMANKLGCQRPVIFLADSVRELYDVIKQNKDPNFEGVVVTFLDGMKVKIKSNLYVQLHKVLTGSLSRDTKFELWLEINKSGKIAIIEELRLPDEFFSDIIRDVDSITQQYNSFLVEINSVFLEMKKDYKNGSSRKDMALKWEGYRWLLSSIFSEQNNIEAACLKVFRKNYMDGVYG